MIQLFLVTPDKIVWDGASMLWFLERDDVVLPDTWRKPIDFALMVSCLGRLEYGMSDGQGSGNCSSCCSPKAFEDPKELVDSVSWSNWQKHTYTHMAQDNSIEIQHPVAALIEKQYASHFAEGLKLYENRNEVQFQIEHCSVQGEMYTSSPYGADVPY